MQNYIFRENRRFKKIRLKIKRDINQERRKWTRILAWNKPELKLELSGVKKDWETWIWKQEERELQVIKKNSPNEFNR